MLWKSSREQIFAAHEQIAATCEEKCFPSKLGETARKVISIARKLISAGHEQLSAARNRISSARAQISSGRKQISSGRDESSMLETIPPKLDNAEKDLADARADSRRIEPKVFSPNEPLTVGQADGLVERTILATTRAVVAVRRSVEMAASKFDTMNTATTPLSLVRLYRWPWRHRSETKGKERALQWQ